MGKVIGLFTVASMVGASVWLLGGGEPLMMVSAQTGSAGESSSTGGGYSSAARRFLEEARRMATRGDLKGAKRLARTAAMFPVEWAQDEQTPDEFLQSLNQASDNNIADSANTPAEDFLPPWDDQVPPGDAEGNNATTTTGTSVPNPFAAGGVFAGDDRPTEFTTPPEDSEPSVSGFRNNSIGTANGFDMPVVESPADVPEPSPETARSEHSLSPTEPPTVPISRRGQAIVLVRQARAALGRGDIAEARLKALQARQLGVTYGLFDDRPEHILAEIERQTGEQTFPAESSVERDSEPFVGADAGATEDDELNTAKRLLAMARQAMEKGDHGAARQLATLAAARNVEYGPFDDTPELLLQDLDQVHGRSQTQHAAGSRSEDWSLPESEDGIRGQAQALLKSARTDLAEGRFEAAREKALAAGRFDVDYDLFEDRPELVLADIDNMAASRLQRSGSSSTDEPDASRADGAQPAPFEMPYQEQSSRADYETARGLLESARSSLAGGMFEEAREQALRAQKLGVAWAPSDDRPETILAEIEKAIAESHNALVTGEPDQSNEVDASTVATISDPGKRHRAVQQILADARIDLHEGRVQDARNKVTALLGLDVVYGVFDDRPEVVLRDIEQYERSTGPDFGEFRLPAESAEPNRIEELTLLDPFDEGSQQPNPPAAVHDGASEDPFSGAHDVAVVHPEGQSALELYNRGVLLLRKGDRNGARSAFLAAWESGEQLDPWRTQQLQDFLSGLAPSTQTDIRLVSASTDSNDPTGPFNAAATHGPELSRLDAVEEERLARYERLHAEILNAVFRAESHRERNPDNALEILDRAAATVEAADLEEQEVESLLSYVRRSHDSINAYKERNRHLIELERDNEETLAQIRKDTEAKIRIEQEFADLVEKFNRLMDQRRYTEAEAVAKQAKELSPDNPTAVVMVWKSQFARAHARNESIRDRKQKAVLEAWHQVEEASIPINEDIIFPDNWEELTSRRRKFNRTDNRLRTEKEKRIEESLHQPISLRFEDATLAEIAAHISTTAGIDVVLDHRALDEEGISTNDLVSIDVDGIMLRSALNLILDPYGLAYTIENEVLMITSRIRQEGRLFPVTYPVADLVVSQPTVVPPGFPQMTPTSSFQNPMASNFSVPGNQLHAMASGAQFQVNDPGLGGAAPWNVSTPNSLAGGSPAVDFASLTELLISTVEPDSWDEVAGNGSIYPSESTLSLVVRQTQRVHDEIRDLLDQLRRLQDLQVTVEVRFISVTDRFFERIGVDFDFNVQDTIGDVPGLPPFGGLEMDLADGTSLDDGNPYQTVDVARPARDDFRHTVVGLQAPGVFTQDFDIAFRQGSFEIGVPDFGNFNPDAGIQVGMAILSDIEAFFFIQAAQGDERANLMFAPKVSLFNGQSATVTDQVVRPFVVSVIPVVGNFAVGFQPVIAQIPDGINLTVQAVISADRRFVRLTLLPLFQNVTDVFTFSFASAGGAGAAGGIGGGGGFGGVGGAGGFGGGGFGFGGIGGGNGGDGGGNGGGDGGGNGGGDGGGGGGGDGAGGASLTVQQPVFEQVFVITTVTVPDGGTVLLGGIKRLREGRNMAGVPILNKIPYISRLFKNTGVGRETESLMLMVTPRIIIQEEEEELVLGSSLE